MREFNQKRRIRKFFFSKTVLFVLIIVCVLVGKAVFNMYEKNSIAEQALSVKMQEIEELKAKESNLNSKMSSLDTNRGIEEEVRGKFSVAKEGEQVFIVTDNPSSTVSSQNKDNPRGFFDSFFDLFW